jgi:hypothetical protein
MCKCKHPPHALFKIAADLLLLVRSKTISVSSDAASGPLWQK